MYINLFNSSQLPCVVVTFVIFINEETEVKGYKVASLRPQRYQGPKLGFGARLSALQL